MRSISTKNLLNKEVSQVIQIDSDHLYKPIGDAEAKGLWLVYGAEKNGKTWFALQLAKALCTHHRVAYISAEEGTDKSFTDAVKRAGINGSHHISWYEYLPKDELIKKFRKRNAAEVIIIDNATMYADELRPVEVKRFESQLGDKLIIMVAHEERKEPYPALAKMAKKMAKVIVNVKGLQAFVVSRFGPGGELLIAQKKGKMFWG